MTITVDTPEGLKSGSAVREVFVQYQPGFMGVQAGGHATLRGEAVEVDLGARGKLFALMRSKFSEDAGYRIFFKVFPGRRA